MSQIEALPQQVRSNWVRLRTLVFVRWAAIVGQSIAVLVAVQVYDFQFHVKFVAMAICASIVANFAVTLISSHSRRMAQKEAAFMLLFDLLQLGTLLFLTGGLNNPFSLLLLAPVTIGANLLAVRYAVSLTTAAVAVIGLLAFFHLPIASADGTVIEQPALLELGTWLALTIGTIFISVYTRQVSTEVHEMREALVATQMALAREQKLTDLGGVVAAAAHELGTPLATIKLVSAEMVEMLEDDDELRDDAMLIRDQADRCRDILHSMGRAGKDDLHLRRAPVRAVVEEAAEPHTDRGRAVNITLTGEGKQPVIMRKPEIIHSLRNFIQNAVDFSTAEVDVTIHWTEQYLTIRVHDDGPGFPPSILSRIGNPFVHRRPWEEVKKRPGYDGMGLGLFIAKTLIERTGAKLAFSNDAGAVVVAQWPLERVLADENGALGDNLLFSDQV